MDNSTNSSDGEASEGYVLNTRRKIMLSLDILIFIIGFIGNGSVIFITLRHKGLRTIPNLMITNLALGDLMMILLVVFVNILRSLLQSVRYFMYRYCEFFFFIQFLSLGVSVLTLTALSVDRYTTVAYPMHKQRLARRLTVWTVVGIWVSSFAVVCPLWFGLIDDMTCWFEDNNSYTAYILSLVIILFIIPTVVMVACYYFTAKKLLHRNASLNLDPRGGHKQRKKRSRLAIIVLVMTIAFILCSFLVYVWLIVNRFSPNHRFVHNMVLKETKSLLVKINSIINPIILYLMSTTHRRYFMHHFCFCFTFSKKKECLITQTQPITNGTETTRQIVGRSGHFSSKEGMSPIKEEDSRI